MKQIDFLDIIKKLKKIYEERMFISSFNFTLLSRLHEDLGMDSLDITEFFMEVENQFNLDEIGFDQMKRFETINDVVLYISDIQENKAIKDKLIKIVSQVDSQNMKTSVAVDKIMGLFGK